METVLCKDLEVYNRGIKAMIKDTIDKHQVKITVATSIAVMLFIIIASVNFATWKAEKEAEYNELDDRITHMGEKYVTIRAEVEDLEDRANGHDLNLVEIKVELVNIKSLLVEIKQNIKDQEKN